MGIDNTDRDSIDLETNANTAFIALESVYLKTMPLYLNNIPNIQQNLVLYTEFQYPWGEGHAWLKRRDSEQFPPVWWTEPWYNPEGQDCFSAKQSRDLLQQGDYQPEDFEVEP